MPSSLPLSCRALFGGAVAAALLVAAPAPGEEIGKVTTAIKIIGANHRIVVEAFDDPKVETIAEIIRRNTKMAIGVVSNAELEDATPAAVVSHTRQRGTKAEIVDMFYAVHPDVILGGPKELPV